MTKKSSLHFCRFQYQFWMVSTNFDTFVQHLILLTFFDETFSKWRKLLKERESECKVFYWIGPVAE